MDKNWLIRTKSNHILGPISKEKVVELYKNSSIKPDDEICSGNGYWFFVREQDMVARFLLGEELQGFNPISEAKDVLTQTTDNTETPQLSDDITMVGGLDLSLLNPAPPPPEVATPLANQSQEKELSVPETKKKNNVVPRPKGVYHGPKKPLKRQNYLKYIGIFAFICLFLLVYFRKTIIRSLFQGEITIQSFSLIGSAHAQDKTSTQKKKLLDSSISFDEITFRPLIGLDGLKVISAFDIEEISCEDLGNDLHQLGIILHPPEFINENFLIKMRDCVVKLDDTHAVKRWMKWVAQSRPLTPKQQEKQKFLIEIISSQFNLITDLKVKSRIINILDEVKENSLPEKILKSYLYLMIGNVTRSDNILNSFINLAPSKNWESSEKSNTFYHKLGKEQFPLIMKKMSKHPADRRTFELFSLYLQSFYNDAPLVSIADSVDTSAIESKLDLRNIQGIAPALVKYLRISKLGDSQRFNILRDPARISLAIQSYWIWPFFDIAPLVSDFMIPELKKIEEEDELWFIYLMNDEKLADLFSKKSGKSFLPGRRPFLKSNLDNKHKFMLTLYKLIELGDVNQDLVIKTADYLIHD